MKVEYLCSRKRIGSIFLEVIDVVYFRFYLYFLLIVQNIFTYLKNLLITSHKQLLKLVCIVYNNYTWLKFKLVYLNSKI